MTFQIVTIIGDPIGIADKKANNPTLLFGIT